jgi:hypothetical protein
MRAAPVFKRISFGSSCDTPGKDRQPPGEKSRGLLEGLAVLGDVGNGILTAIDRDRAEGPHDRANDRHAEQRCLGEKGNGPRREAQEEERIDERVGMVDDENHRTLPWNALGAFVLDSPEEEAKDQAKESAKNHAGPRSKVKVQGS